MLDAPGDDLPAIPDSQNLPFGALGPIFLLLQQPPGRRDLLVVAALRVLGMLHTGGLASASAEQNEKQSDHPESGHPRPIGMRPSGLRGNKAKPRRNTLNFDRMNRINRMKR